MTLGLGGPRRSQGRELNGCSHKVASFCSSLSLIAHDTFQEVGELHTYTTWYKNFRFP